MRTHTNYMYLKQCDITIQVKFVRNITNVIKYAY